MNKYLLQKLYSPFPIFTIASNFLYLLYISNRFFSSFSGTIIHKHFSFHTTCSTSSFHHSHHIHTYQPVNFPSATHLGSIYCYYFPSTSPTSPSSNIPMASQVESEFLLLCDIISLVFFTQFIN